MNLERLRDSHGQALALMVISLTAIILAVGVTIDGGNAFQNQRAVQNGSDAASIAGAVQLGNHASCRLNPCTGPTDGDIRAAVDASAAANNIAVLHAYYTDVCGLPLRPDGQPALQGNTVDLSQAAEVGVDGIPADAGNSPNCTTQAPGPPAGVLVLGHRDIATFIAGMIGINTFSIDTQATAVSTYGACSSSQGCALIPIGFPTHKITCNGSEPVDSSYVWPRDPVVSVVPLCSSNGGNVTYLDWDPPAGGTQDLIAAIYQPDNSPVTFPSWQFISQTGNINANQLEVALRDFDGKIVKVPIYEHTCDDWGDSRLPQINDPAQNYGCSGTLDNGHGQGTWWRLIQLDGFKLCDASDADCAALGYDHGAYVNGNNQPDCDPTSTIGATACLVGKFVTLDDSGLGGDGAAPVQLIK